MNELIKIQTNEQGQQLVSARELYLGLGLDKSQWSRWYKKNIQENEFFLENNDWVVLDTMTTTEKGGQVAKNFAISLDFAKHIAMMARTEKSHEYRNYFIQCERKLKEQSNTPMLSPLQKCGLILLGNNSSDMEKLQALSEFRELSNNEGKVLVCDDGTITIPQIRDYVMKHYGDILFENDVLISENFIEWTRFLRNIGYIKYVTFNKKGKEYKEAKPTPQPTDLFKDTFVKQGMAMVRSTNDERNKEIITYTKDIEKFIVSDYFKENFFKYFNVA